MGTKREAQVQSPEHPADAFKAMSDTGFTVFLDSCCLILLDLRGFPLFSISSGTCIYKDVF